MRVTCCSSVNANQPRANAICIGERKREKAVIQMGMYICNVGRRPKGVRVHKTPVAPHTPRRL